MSFSLETLRTEEMAAPRVVIIGGGVGGVSAAQQLAKANFADVTVIDRYDDHANVCVMATDPGSFELCRQTAVRSTAAVVCTTDFAEHMCGDLCSTLALQEGLL